MPLKEKGLAFHPVPMDLPHLALGQELSGPPLGFKEVLPKIGLDLISGEYLALSGMPVRHNVD
jgi:hypothetical protein